MAKEKNEKKDKKLNKENISKNIDYTSKKLDVLMHNRLILAIFMIIDGIGFILNPNLSMNGMAQTIASTAFLAAGAILINYIKNKSKDIKTITLPILMIILSALIFIFPRPLAINLRIILGIFIILNGLINIFNIKKLDKISANLSHTEDSLKKKIDKGEKSEEYNKNVVLDQTKRITDPLNKVIEKANKNFYLYLILNIISVFLGALLFTTDNITIIIVGCILLYSGLFDMLMYIRAYLLKKKENDKKKTKEKEE